MSAAIQYEIRLLASGLSVGICLMAAYDGLRLFRFAVHHKSFWTGMEDALYWSVSAIVTFSLLLNQNDGVLRGYAIIGVLGGMLVYNGAVSRNLIKLLIKCRKYFTMKQSRKKSNNKNSNKSSNK